jgi:hypothetical protein
MAITSRAPTNEQIQHPSVDALKRDAEVEG